MTRELLVEMALRVAVELLNKQNPTSTSPARMALEAIADNRQNEYDVAIIKYIAEHKDAT